QGAPLRVLLASRRIVLRLPSFDERHEHIQPVAFRRVTLRGHQTFDFLQRATIVAMILDWSDVHPGSSFAAIQPLPRLQLGRGDDAAKDAFNPSVPGAIDQCWSNPYDALIQTRWNPMRGQGLIDRKTRRAIEDAVVAY